MFDPQAGTGHQQCHPARVMNADGNAAGNQYGIARLHRQRFRKAGAQVHGCGTVGGIGWQGDAAAHERIHDFGFNFMRVHVIFHSYV